MLCYVKEMLVLFPLFAKDGKILEVPSIKTTEKPRKYGESVVHRREN